MLSILLGMLAVMLSETFGPLDAERARELGLVAILTVMAGAMSIWLSGYLVRPLRDVSESARALGSGDLRRRVEITSGDEIEELGRSFNDMAEQLQQTVERLEAARFEAVLFADYATRVQSVTAALSQAVTPDQVADAIMSHGLAALSARAGFIRLLTDDGKRLQVIRTLGYPMGERPEFESMDVDANAPIADAVRTGQIVVIRSLEERNASYPLLAENRVPIGAAFAAIPLIQKGRAVGGMGLSFAEPRSFDERDQAFMLTLGRQCALALDRARLYETEQRLRAEAETAAAQIRETNEALIAAKELALRRAAEAERAVRMRDEFVSVAAHELKTPLTSILGFSQVMIRQLEKLGVDDPGAQRSAAMVEQHAKKLATLISHLLDVSRIESGKLALDLQPTDLRLLAEGVVEMVQAKGVGCPMVVRGAGTARAMIDPIRIEQVLINLLDNAVKFSPKGRPIEVELSSAGHELVKIAVRDQGVGIPPERRDRIFDRFQQAHGEGHLGGMGLGLHISYQIVQLHGGTIDVSFPTDGGTRFVVSLPVTPGARVTPESQNLRSSHIPPPDYPTTHNEAS